MTKKENTKLINLLFEVYRKGAEGIECNLDDSLKELLEAINVIQCCKSDSEQSASKEKQNCGCKTKHSKYWCTYDCDDK